MSRSAMDDARSPGVEKWYSYGDCCVSLVDHPARVDHRATLILVHGRFGSSDLWKPIARLLSNHYRCLLLDLPGFGRSYCPSGRGVSLESLARLLALVAESTEDARPVVLIGHDIGGALVQHCAMSAPERIQGIVLINSSFIAEPVRELPMRYRGWATRLKLLRLLRESTSLPQEERINLLAPWLIHEERLALVRALHGIQSTWPGEVERDSWRRKVGRLAQPALLLWGARDRLNRLECAYRLLRTLPEAYFYQNESCGHWPCLEDPAWVTHKLREFLFRTSHGEQVYAVPSEKIFGT